ncbi:MAG: methyltransferase domain-containing protein, partial [Odoribacter sp.]
MQKIIVEKLYTLLTEQLSYTPERVLEIGCGTGFLTRKLRQHLSKEQLYINDLVEEMCRKTAGSCDIEANHCLVGDIEQLHLKETYNLIVSASTFQWFARPSETFKKLAEHLHPGGLMVFSTFGWHNLEELREVTGRGLSYLSMEEVSALLSPYFEVLVREEELHTLRFNEPL